LAATQHRPGAIVPGLVGQGRSSPVGISGLDVPRVSASLPRPPPTKMAKKKKKKEIVHLVCSETGERNYTIRKRSGTPKLQLKKYCPRLRRHTLHVEKKK